MLFAARMAPVRLLINAIPLLGEESGIGNYTREIGAYCLENDCDVTFFYGYHSKRLREAPKKGYGSWLGTLKGVARKGSFPRRLAKKTLHLINAAANMINPTTWDCYFEPNFVLLPTLHANHSVITVHDFSCFRYPQWHPAERVGYMEKFFWKSVEKAEHLVTVSQTVRQEAIDMFGLDASKITAIPNGVNHAQFYPRDISEIMGLRKKYGLPEAFILYVGALEPRKNLCNLVRAHALLPENLQRAFPLLLIGSQGWHNDDLFELLRKNARHVRLLGHVPNADLPIFYSACSLFAYPSWYEGFGLPVLEAMTCGKAVLVSDTPALTELYGGAGKHANPADPEMIAARLRELLEDEQQRHLLEKKALLRAARFGWRQSAKAHLELFQKLAGLC